MFTGVHVSLFALCCKWCLMLVNGCRKCERLSVCPRFVSSNVASLLRVRASTFSPDGVSKFIICKNGVRLMCFLYLPARCAFHLWKQKCLWKPSSPSHVVSLLGVVFELACKKAQHRPLDSPFSVVVNHFPTAILYAAINSQLDLLIFPSCGIPQLLRNW